MAGFVADVAICMGWFSEDTSVELLGSLPTRTSRNGRKVASTYQSHSVGLVLAALILKISMKMLAMREVIPLLLLLFVENICPDIGSRWLLDISSTGQ